ncbi:MAG: hypothetical protein MJZ23_07365 [Paludibacteraceae bacterium]|nr:hypothetical protein [Paludibacteraceae bacterium]
MRPISTLFLSIGGLYKKAVAGKKQWLAPFGVSHWLYSVCKLHFTTARTYMVHERIAVSLSIFEYPAYSFGSTSIALISLEVLSDKVEEP